VRNWNAVSVTGAIFWFPPRIHQQGNLLLKANPFFPPHLKNFKKKLFLLMSVTITNKVFLQNKNFKTKRKRKETNKQKRLRKRRTLSLVGLTSNMHSSGGNNTTSFYW